MLCLCLLPCYVCMLLCLCMLLRRCMFPYYVCMLLCLYRVGNVSVRACYVCEDGGDKVSLCGCVRIKCSRQHARSFYSFSNGHLGTA
jgi:hypothetical protein